MPPVLGPSSPSKIRLKSWAGWQRVDRRAVGDREQRHLGAVEELLDHHPLALRGVGRGRVPVVGHHDALAGGEAVVLDDVRRAEGVEGGGDLGRRRADVRRRGRHPGRGHHVLGERLGALELGGLAGRAEAADPAVAHGVGDARDQRRLGTDDDEVGAERLGQVGDGGTVQRVDVVQRGERRDARVAGRGVHLGDRRIAGEGERERVLAAAGADDEDLHVRRCYRAEGSGVARPVRRRTPTRPRPAAPPPANDGAAGPGSPSAG